MATATVRVVLAGADGRADLAVPVGVTLRELLAASGIDADAVEVVGSSGELVEPDAVLGEDARDGFLLSVHAGAHPRRSREEIAARAAAGARVEPAPLAVVLVLVLVGALLVASLLGEGAWWTAIAAVPLAAAAVALLAHPASRRSAVLSLLAPPLALGAAAAAMPVGVERVGAIVAGIVVGATVASVRHGIALRRIEPLRPLTGISALLWALASVVAVGSLMLGTPGTTAAALLVGAVPLLLRIIPATAIDIPETDLLDLPHLIREAPSVRDATPPPPRRVDRDRVRDAIRSGTRRTDAGAVMVCATGAVAAFVVLAGTPEGTLASWASLAGIGLVALGLVLSSRSAHHGLAKVMPRAAAGVMLAALALLGIPALPVDPAWGALALAGSGVLAIAAIGPIARGWRSLGWSRAGDILEGLCLVFAPGLMLLGSGLIDAIGRLTA
ncbi:hypothetical protein [Homoserinibacter sp. YIM 151385]|uniref:hypothetical protein n=1 Tax=Homoserinibacter sp. YIM 151385 TaxID=2985506 RepID=UPI0022F0688A|nr:hypothetical protein [Homoserinibacter sp. YIM 151385]WBU38687.1 hypothetical protein OF852_03630 [Homoserinibacter sp. YIM 151385]